MLITSTNNALDYFPQIRVLGLCQNQDLFSSFFECLHISPADELNALAVEDYNSCLAQLESHGHNCHAANDEEWGKHEVLGVIGHNVTKADGSECDETEVVGVKALEFSFPQRQNQTAKKDVGKHNEKNEYKWYIQHFHSIP